MINSISNISSLMNGKPNSDKFGQPKVRISVDKKDNGLVKINQTDAEKLASEKISLTDKTETSSIKKDIIDFSDLGEKLKEILGENNLSIEFSIDNDTQKMVVKFLDSETDEVIQQFPPEVTLKITKIIAEHFGVGQITNTKV